MFTFKKKSVVPLGDASSAGKWLASLPTGDPLRIQREVLKALHKLAESTTPRTVSGLKALFTVDAHTKGLFQSLIAQYAEQANRSTKIEDQLWQALLDLNQGFQACYGAFTREIQAREHHRKWQALLPELIARQIAHFGLDARFRFYRCGRWIPAKWIEFHALFGYACSRQIERQPLPLDPKGEPTTIEHQYLIALVLQLADAGDLTPAQLEWVASQLEAWCRPLRLTVEPRAAMTFYVDVAGTAGLRRRTLGPLEGSVLFVDTRRLHAVLLQERGALEQAIRNDPSGTGTPEQLEQLELLIKLANRIDPEFRPLPRQGERVPASGAVDAIIGFANISGFLRDEEPPPTPAPRPNGSRTFGSAIEVAIFGRSRARIDDHVELAPRRLAVFAAPGGPWEMKDLSSSGFRLHAPMSIATNVTLSMLVAIDRRGEDGIVMGIVRRMRRLSVNYAEIGLQLIAKTLVRADLVEVRRVSDGENATSAAKQTALAGRRFPGLCISFSRHADEAPVQSLIIPPVEYQPSWCYALETKDATRAIRFGRLLEQHPDWLWTVIDPIEPDAGATGAPPEAAPRE